MSECINLDGIGPVQVERYSHGGGRVWREEDGGGRDLLMDLYAPAERRDEIIEKLSEAHAATVAALEERVKKLEQRDEYMRTRFLQALGDQARVMGPLFRISPLAHAVVREFCDISLAPTEEGGRDA